jgi:hypothetical protein
MVPLWWACAVIISACEFHCNSNLCGDNSNVTIISYTFNYWTQAGVNSVHNAARVSITRPTIDLTGRGITSIAVGGLSCSNWPSSTNNGQNGFGQGGERSPVCSSMSC